MRITADIIKLIAALFLAANVALCVEGETFVVPLTRTNGWQFLTYRGIPPNVFSATPAGLEIGVTNSAAPAIYPLDCQRQITAIRVAGTIRGSLKIPANKQGEPGFDDYAVRIGLVESGNRTLSWKEKLFAAGWVKKLFALAPTGTGISKIHFFNVGVDRSQIGRTRTHPLSNLMLETVTAIPDQNGNFTFTNEFNPPLNIIAVWISCDGDDTKSSYSTLLHRVELETKPTSLPK